MPELDSDRELFNSATDPTPATPAVDPVEPPKVEPKDVPRDEAGRFAPKDKPETTTETPAAPIAAEPATPAQQEPEDRQGIPGWRLREEAEAKREALKRAEAAEAERTRYQAELAAMQQRLASLEKPKVGENIPDPLVDPAGYRAYFDKQMNERLLNQQREFDMRLAHSRHGQVFEKAYAEAQQAIRQGDAQLLALMQSASSPGETMVNWYKQRETMRTVGSDPNAWLEKQLEERLNDPAFLAKAMERARTKATANPPAKPAVSLPPSLSNISGAGAQMSDPDDGDQSDAAVFRRAFR